MRQLIYSSFISIALLFAYSLNSQILVNITGTGNFPGQVQGESTITGFENQIEATAYSNAIAGCQSTVSGSGGGACKTSIGSLAFTMKINRSVIPLKYFATNGLTLPSVDISFRSNNADGKYVYYRIRLENVLVSAIEEGGTTSELPTISVELTPGRIAWAYYQQKSGGSPTLTASHGWSIADHTPWNYQF